MPRKAQQKAKILTIARIFLEETDEEHPITMKDLLRRLEAEGIPAERKSIYSDFEELRLFGFDIVSRKEKTTGYFLASRDFEMPELRLIIDAIRSSHFITAKKSRTLIAKVAKLAGRHEARRLIRNEFVNDRIKAKNESIFLSIDRIEEAIGTGRKITFQYLDWDEAGNQILRHNGALYKLSPQGLIWDNEKYYLIGRDERTAERRTFRVDKMVHISVTKEKQAETEPFDPSEITGSVFSMFGGKEESVTFRCQKEMAGVMIDRFGNIPFRKTKDGFECTAAVEISPTFFGWLIGLRDRVEVLSPQEVREELAQLGESLSNRYGRDHS